ncbi:copper amine oxidase N-terminal domain-containing protein [Paenibacillus sp. sgz500958]|uniref:copper amine oxidase N-terminal domain-containing protein n=1 Tax=Paenibacillus sp. sgz500958 TaxID=3242475 RepID=UPI0036D29724
MKKLVLSFLLFITCLNLPLQGTVSAESGMIETSVFLNGHYLNLAHQPVIKNGVVYAPLKELLEELGGKLTAGPAKNTLVALIGNTSIQLQLNSRNIRISGKTLQMNAAVIVMNGTTMVPVKFLSFIGIGTVAWSQTNRVLSITSPLYSYQTGFITKIYENGGKRYVQMDLNEWFYRIEDILARPDVLADIAEEFNVDEPITEDNIYDYIDLVGGYYIYAPDHAGSNLEVSGTCKVSVPDYDTLQGVGMKTVSFETLKKNMNPNATYEFRILNDTVIKITEYYQP